MAAGQRTFLLERVAGFFLEPAGFDLLAPFFSAKELVPQMCASRAARQSRCTWDGQSWKLNAFHVGLNIVHKGSRDDPQEWWEHQLVYLPRCRHMDLTGTTHDVASAMEYLAFGAEEGWLRFVSATIDAEAADLSESEFEDSEEAGTSERFSDALRKFVPALARCISLREFTLNTSEDLARSLEISTFAALQQSRSLVKITLAMPCESIIESKLLGECWVISGKCGYSSVLTRNAPPGCSQEAADAVATLRASVSGALAELDMKARAVRTLEDEQQLLADINKIARLLEMLRCTTRSGGSEDREDIEAEVCELITELSKALWVHGWSFGEAYLQEMCGDFFHDEA